MGNSSVSVTPGSGANIDTFQIASGDQQQIIRQAVADAVSSAGSATWTVSKIGRASCRERV